MQDKLDIRTSASLLEKLRIFQEQQAWERFMSLYTPLLAAWGRRAGLPEHEVEELIGRLQLKLVQEIPSFVYDPAKRFRSWLKTLVNHELANIAREAGARYPARKGRAARKSTSCYFSTRTAWTTSSKGCTNVRSACSGCSMTPWKRFALAVRAIN